MKANYPPSQSLIQIISPLVEMMYIMETNLSKLRLLRLGKNVEHQEILFDVEIPHSIFLRIIMIHICEFICFLKVIKEIDVLMFSQLSIYPVFLSLLARLLKRKILIFIGGSRYGIVRLIMGHSFPYLHKMGLIWGLCTLKLSMLFANRIVVITDYLLSDKIYKKFKYKISVAYNFPSPEFHKNFYITKPYSKREKIVGYVGALIETKGILLLLNAIPEVFKKSPDAKFIIIGNLHKISNKVRSEINKIRKLYSNRVIFEGYVSHDKLPLYFNEMKLLVMPSFSEGIPHVLLEAMACGVPVLSHRVGGIPSIIHNGKNGFLITKHSAQILSDLITFLLKNEKTLQNISRNAHLWIKKNINIEMTRAMWSDILKNL